MLACLVLDTHAIARQLAGAGLSVEQADAITAALRQAAEHSERVTPETLRAELPSSDRPFTQHDGTHGDI